jgi:outer membrane protein assembly factor BamD
MKVTHIISFALLLAVVGSAYTQRAVAADNKPKLTREEKKREKERLDTERATASTEAEVREGKRPTYNRLLKSTNYRLMYTEGLRYYNLKKAGKDYNSQANYTKAQNLLSEALESGSFSGTPQEDSLVYFLGCSFYKAGDFDVSEQLFDRFRRQYGGSRFIEDVEYMYAMGFYFSSPEPEYDQTTTIRAMSAINEYTERYPNTIKKEECAERMDELRRKLYIKSYENARLYYTIQQYKAAVRALGNAIDEFPESPYREDLMYLATKSSYLFAKNSLPSLMADRYMSMMDNYYNLISEYPETEHLREVERMHKEAKEYIEKHTNQQITEPDNGK